MMLTHKIKKVNILLKSLISILTSFSMPSVRRGEIMKKFYLLLCILACFVSVANAQEEQTESTSSLNLNVRRIALELSSTEVKHSQQYQDSPITQFTSDSQTVIKGLLDVALEYERDVLRWDNRLFAEYAKTKLKPADGPDDTNETADKILLTSTYTHKVWTIDTAHVGPFTQAEYQTEFKRNADDPRQKVVRGKAGIKLFDGVVFKDLYLAGVGEYDMTYDPQVSKSAVEAGFRMENELREGVKFYADGYYRKYLSYSEYVGSDLKYDLNMTARMDVALNSTLSMGPYVSYRRARSREADVDASNFMIGLSFSYTDLFKFIGDKKHD